MTPVSEPRDIIEPDADSAGGRARFVQVFQAQRARMEALVSRRVGCRATASDLVQELFLRFWRRPEVKVESLDTYLLRCAGNLAIDHLRSESSRERVAEAAVPVSEASLAQAPEQAVEVDHDLQRIEATLQQMQRLEAVGQLTAGVAHDFNNLLTVILTSASFLKSDLERGAPLGKSLARLQYIQDSGERGATLTSQLLAFARRQQLAPKAVDLNDTLVSLLSLLKSTLGGSVSIETDTQANIWHALVDPTQIEMIILNLAINARDAMPKGGGR